MEYTHLLYVRKYNIISDDYDLYVYGVNTRDIFHTMGEIIYRSETQIKRIDFKELTDENKNSVLNYWKENNKTILKWQDKYNVR